MEYHVAMTESTNNLLNEFLLNDLDDEEICFATWSPSQGKTRLTILINEVIFPQEGERERHGNVSATPEYVDRAKEIARLTKKGLVMIHTHPLNTGPQGVSVPDLHYEQDVLSREVFGITNLPFVGMTLSGDGMWSARCYPKPHTIQWCAAVRLVGKNLTIHFNPKVMPAPESGNKLVTTASVWGDDKHVDLMRLKVGIIGAGSVGAAVGEILSRIGVGNVMLMEYDTIKLHNLDRMLGVSEDKTGKRKADVVAQNMKKSATNPDFECRVSYNSIAEAKGYEEAKDCDVIFSCVDRPWPRQVLNHIAYSCLIPVVDGGVSFYIPHGKFVHGMYRVQTVGPERACMECLGAYSPTQVQQDREGLFDDPEYITKQEYATMTKTRQNIMPFVFSLAGLETTQFIELVTNLGGLGDLGQQPYNYVPGDLLPINKKCVDGCPYVKIIGLGDSRLPHLSKDISKEREMNSCE